MLFSTIAYLFFAAIAVAQTPPNFSPNITSTLQVKFGSKSVTPGLALTKAETSKVPTIGTSDEALNETYIFFMIDLDVPGSLVGGAAGSRVTNLHCLLTGFTSSTMATNSMYTLTTKDTSPKAYVGPAPPAENPPYAHKYVEILYPQPAGFKVPSTQTSAISRGIGFNLTAFVSEAKLGSPVRANWFTVTG
ncbi:phosphatidylethanolamine-binding protein [Rhexocercosporidium sp. MPI-PUGE-AT-0058]|nr:phosphatidylethanolamine-binding protein [Rhexocercosporidium sp. MPI-PUGE-AT-0058]